jgi:hypothetical protein
MHRSSKFQRRSHFRSSSRRATRHRLPALERLESRHLLAANLVISELMAQNGTTLKDEDGAFSDWIEVQNRSPAAVNLDGYYLTDSAHDLTKWRFPSVTLEAGGYLTVFADSKNRVNPTAPLHTNFGLSAGGEYLALVDTDGSTVLSSYDPSFPEQVTDVSYGLEQQTTVFVDAGSPTSYLIPSAAQAGLGDTWAAMGFNDSSWTKTQNVPKSKLLLTELGTGTTALVEVQNMTSSTLETKGWFVAVNDPTQGINGVNASLWNLPDTFTAAQVRYRTDSASDNYWGSDIAWSNSGNGWAMIVDSQGKVIDFAAWGYTSAQIQSLNVSLKGFTITSAGVWSGNGNAASGTNTNSLQRQGTADADTSANFSFVATRTKGTQNASLTVPFTATVAVPTTQGIGYGIVQPGFTVRQIDVNGGANGTLDSTTEALNVLAGNFAPSDYFVTVDITTVSQTLNFGGGLGNFAGDSPYLDGTSDTDLSDFAMQANATVTIPVGTWTIGFGSDDGGRLALGGLNFSGESGTNGDTPGDGELRYEAPRGHSWTSGTFTVTGSPLTTTLSAMFYERGGGDSWEVAIRAGAGDANYVSAGTLLSDGALGWHVNSPISTGIQTNVQTAMQNVNSSLWSRTSFEVADPSVYDSLALAMQYNDGFVAYLNGTQVASRNAPASPTWNSTATQAPAGGAAISENINLTDFLNLLQPGTNVLAIRGLNASASDSSFLILPQLLGVTDTSNARFFATPTPGGPNRGSFVDFVAQPTFSVPHGFYSAPFQLALGTTTAGATIRYTLDGSTPTETHGAIYTTPLTISGTSTVQAFAYRTGYRPSASLTNTYLFTADIVQQSPTGTPPAGFPVGPINGQVLDYGMDPDIVNSPTWGPQLAAALTAIPSLSLVVNLPDLFDPTTGIYVNANLDGRGNERNTSLELIDPSGAEPGFQINAGLRIRGGYSRSDSNPKHSFRLFFRSEYGESDLEYPLFGAEGAQSFDKIDLRTSQNYSWSFEGSDLNTFTNDNFSRITQGLLGDPYSRGRFYHLYINGQYWGLYETDERPGADFGASYLGGSDDNWDAVKSTGSDGGYTVEASDGNTDAWRALWDLSNQIATAPNQAAAFALYQKAQGNNPDGTRNPSYPVLLDTQNLIDYMLIILYTGNKDAPISAFLGNNATNNWFALRDRTGDKGFIYIAHDSEHTLLTGDLNINRNGPWPAGSDFAYSSPQWIHQQLMAVDEYRLQFADTVQKTMTGNGVLTPAAATARYLAKASEIQSAIIAESARWGDAKSSVPKTKDTWQAAINDVVNNYFPQRTNVVISQFQATQRWTDPINHTGLVAAPLYPALAAPIYSQAPGVIAPGTKLFMSSTAPQVYYTLDGSDPRLAGGGIAPSALLYDPTSSSQTLVATGSAWKYRDNGIDLGSTWRDPAFNDAAWASGAAKLGYGDGDEATVVGFGPDSNNRYITTYFRKSFNVADASRVSALTLRLRRDDGAVVYLNGQEVVRSNMPTGTIAFNTLASATVGGADETTFFTFTIPISALRTGANVLAVEVHQSVNNSSDLSFDLSLAATIANGAPITLSEPTEVNARAYSAGQWSALNEARFVLSSTPAAAGNFALTEVNYNPGNPTAAELAVNPAFSNNDFEFVELHNLTSGYLDLTGVRFSAGITFDFTNSSLSYLAPGALVLVVKNAEAFATRYGSGLPVAGVYSGSLDNGGERVALVDKTGATIHDFVYDDTAPWPTEADGGGKSLEVIDVAGDYSDYHNWRGSSEINGTPGTLGAVNQAPTDISLSNATVAENSAGAAIGTLTVTDPNVGDTFTFTLSDNRFEVAGQQLKLKSGISLDYEAAASITLNIAAADNGGLGYAKDFVIALTNVNEAPTQLNLANATVLENSPGAVVGALSASDPDAGDTIAYSVSDSRFEAPSGQLKLKPGQSLQFATTPSVDLTVTATDAGGLSTSKLFTIAVISNNQPPTDISLSNATADENSAGAAIGTLTVTDPNAGDTFTFALSDNRFEVAGQQLELKPGISLDFEAAAAISLDVTATDNGGLSFTKTFTINVANVNEAPTQVTLTGLTVPENSVAAIVGTLEVTDPDAGDTFTFLISDSRFEASNGQLKLKPGQSLDFETAISINLTITAVDSGGLSVLRPFTITVTDVNEAPVNLSLTANSISENSPGASVGTASASDPDGDGVTFSTPDARFQFVGNTLRLRPGQALDYEASSTVTVTVIATDTGGLSAQKDFVLNVTNVPEAATGISLSRSQIFSNLPGAWVATVTVLDVDGSNNLSVNDSRFTISEGELRIKSGQLISVAPGTIIPITITARDTNYSSIAYAQPFSLVVVAAPSPWNAAHQWALNRFDVNADGQVTPLDALLVINEFNAVGPHSLPAADPGTAAPLFLDTNGDHFASPIDALLIINYLNTGERGEAPSTASTDAAFADPVDWILWQSLTSDEKDLAKRAR